VQRGGKDSGEKYQKDKKKKKPSIFIGKGKEARKK
jgi:hypothetical protein